MDQHAYRCNFIFLFTLFCYLSFLYKVNAFMPLSPLRQLSSHMFILLYNYLILSPSLPPSLAPRPMIYEGCLMLKKNQPKMLVWDMTVMSNPYLGPTSTCGKVKIPGISNVSQKVYKILQKQLTHVKTSCWNNVSEFEWTFKFVGQYQHSTIFLLYSGLKIQWMRSKMCFRNN